MMTLSRVLIVPAAGLGSRLGASVPKLLVPVAGIPMIDRILDLYAGRVSRVAVVVNPAFSVDVRRHLESCTRPMTIDCVEQRWPTGMLDAILLAAASVRRSAPTSVWITWCDQVAVQRMTIDRLAAATGHLPHPAVVMPAVFRENPYIHFERDASGRITRVLHRREGDPMPAQGESDMGLFALSPLAYNELLPQYASQVEAGGATGERNFLPFIPWVAREHEVMTFPCSHPMEAVGVNTPEELRMVEAYLRTPRPA
jgi:bifunctional UDP-N-acetylglucosamine pyrophosphorylase/glucosamine-1-phosphate N-acetyltransferase